MKRLPLPIEAPFKEDGGNKIGCHTDSLLLTDGREIVPLREVEAATAKEKASEGASVD